MSIKIDDYEKLGAFYLGKELNPQNKELSDDLLLYNSKDLVTHGVVLGMTGSGKTGLCISLLEEAAMDDIPSIIIDPKGDIANLMLTFPDLNAEEFKPWINEDDARKKGETLDSYADKQSKLWENGLAKWGQSKQRIQNFKSKTNISIYTPGSNAGLPISILSSLEAPPFEIIDDTELLGDRIESTVTSLLALMGIDADPIQSKEHILLSNIFYHNWSEEKSLTLELLVAQIQSPPFDKIGVLGLDSFYPEKKRFELAMSMNNLLAAPGFKVWLKGEDLNIKKMLYTQEGKPKISIFSIAHLSDSERMFFVSLLLNQTLSWMRTQSGTSSLRALLYMDEIYGYLPPIGNPPSKKPLMTILKQARAFGLGTLLATQNPVDLDYKALSNIGTWFLGRLQTDRDKARVLDGLEGSSSSQGTQLNRKQLEKMLSSLGSRQFLLNNVHDNAPKLFQVRWVMSYLRGPLTRGQIRNLMKNKKDQISKKTENSPTNDTHYYDLKNTSTNNINITPPVLPKTIKQLYLKTNYISEDKPIVYKPNILGDFTIQIKKKNINTKQKILKAYSIADAENLNFEKFININTELETDANNPILLPNHQNPVKKFKDLPGSALDVNFYNEIEKELEDWLFKNFSINIFKSDNYDETSNPGESESDFRIRLRHLSYEKRDDILDNARKKFDKVIDRLETKIEKATNKLEVQKQQARQAKLSTAISIGSSILGGIFGGRRRSSILSAGRGASKAWKEGRDVDIAEKELDKLNNDLLTVESEMKQELEIIKKNLDPMNEQFEIIQFTPYKKDININKISLLWLPYFSNNNNLEKAW